MTAIDTSATPANERRMHRDIAVMAARAMAWWTDQANDERSTAAAAEGRASAAMAVAAQTDDDAEARAAMAAAVAAQAEANEARAEASRMDQTAAHRGSLTVHHRQLAAG